MDIVTLALAKNYADSIGSGITSIKTENNKLIFTLQNGKIIEVPLTDLVDNVVTEEELLNKLKNYIKNTDFASAENAGIIKVDATSYATELDNGKLKASTKTYENYKDMNNEGFIGKGTLENVLIGKKLETTNNKVTFVDEDSTDIEYPSAKAMYKVSNKLDTLKNDVLETGTDTNTFIHLEDSAMAEYQELSVDGICKQKTISGKNLLNERLFNSLSTSGVQFIANEDGSITIKSVSDTGKTTSDVYGPEVQLDNSLLKAGVLNVKQTKTTFPNVYISVYTSNNEYVTYGNETRPVTILQEWLDNNHKILIKFMASGGSTIIEGTTNIIAYQDGDGTYEPYTGGQHSPNPDYPQEIKTITDSLKIRSNNFNYIFGIDIKETLVGNAALKSVNNGIINIKKTTEKSCNVATYVKPISVKAGDKINVDILNGTINGIFTCQIMDKEWNVIGSYNSSKEENLIKSDGIVEIVMPFIPKTTTFEDVDFVFTLNVEESLETQIAANLPEGEFIGKINDTYKDRLKIEYNEEDGQYHLNLYKNVGKYVFDSSEVIERVRTEFTLSKVFQINNLPSKFNYDGRSINKNSISNSFIYKNNLYNNDISDYSVEKVESSKLRFRVPFDYCEDINEFKTKMQNINLVVYMKLATPYTLDLGIVDMPITYNETTNLFTDSDLMPTINAKYYRNFTSTIQNIQVNNKTLKQELVDINNRLDVLESEINIESYVAKIDEINGEVI